MVFASMIYQCSGPERQESRVSRRARYDQLRSRVMGSTRQSAAVAAVGERLVAKW